MTLESIHLALEVRTVFSYIGSDITTVDAVPAAPGTSMTMAAETFRSVAVGSVSDGLLVAKRSNGSQTMRQRIMKRRRPCTTFRHAGSLRPRWRNERTFRSNRARKMEWLMSSISSQSTNLSVVSVQNQSSR